MQKFTHPIHNSNCHKRDCWDQLGEAADQIKPHDAAMWIFDWILPRSSELQPVVNISDCLVTSWRQLPQKKTMNVYCMLLALQHKHWPHPSNTFDCLKKAHSWIKISTPLADFLKRLSPEVWGLITCTDSSSYMVPVSSRSSWWCHQSRSPLWVLHTQICQLDDSSWSQHSSLYPIFLCALGCLGIG